MNPTCTECEHNWKDYSPVTIELDYVCKIKDFLHLWQCPNCKKIITTDKYEEYN